MRRASRPSEAKDRDGMSSPNSQGMSVAMPDGGTGEAGGAVRRLRNGPPRRRLDDRSEGAGVKASARET